MILFRFLRWLGYNCWTEAELLAELTRMDQKSSAPAYVTVNYDHVSRSEK